MEMRRRLMFNRVRTYWRATRYRYQRETRRRHIRAGATYTTSNTAFITRVHSPLFDIGAHITATYTTHFTL